MLAVVGEHVEEAPVECELARGPEGEDPLLAFVGKLLEGVEDLGVVEVLGGLSLDLMECRETLVIY